MMFKIKNFRAYSLNDTIIKGVIFSVIFLPLAISADILPTPTHQVLPQEPANVFEMPPISNFRNGERSNNSFAYPHMPPFRTTIDGRLAVRVTVRENLEFFLVAPEKLNHHLLLSTPGVQGVQGVSNVSDAPPTSFNLPEQQVFNLTKNERLRGRVICEKSQTNPIGLASGQDRYNFTLIGSVSTKNDGMTMMSQDFVAIINKPKTRDANIESITPVTGTIRSHKLDLASWGKRYVEPNITRDGRLLVVKNSRKVNDWHWNSPTTPSIERIFPRGSRPIIYAFNEQETPCDISGWSEPNPITHAFFDNRINKRYGFAQYQMRDSEGHLFGDGEQIRGSQYPWLSQDGAMLMMALGGEMLHYIDDTTNNSVVRSRYARRCGSLKGGCKGLKKVPGANKHNKYIRRYEDPANVNRGVIATGLWTHGKMVELDNVINYMDYAVNGLDYQHLKLGLYDPTSASLAARGEILIAHNKSIFYDIPLTTGEGAQIGSVENRFNFLPNMSPITPRDIIWQVSKGNGVTAEVAFDDYIDPNVMIYAPMNTSFDNNKYSRLVDPTAEMQGYNNGFARTGMLTGQGFTERVHYQNAATADKRAQISDPLINKTQKRRFFDVPDYGEATGISVNTMRIEPVALGGVRGKGAWLSGEDQAGIRFNLTRQTHLEIPEGETDPLANKSWYYGIFIDPRYLDAYRNVISFPGGSSIAVDPNNKMIRYVNRQQQEFRVIRLNEIVGLTPEILGNKSWTHLGMTVSPDEINLYINGNLIDQMDVTAGNTNPFYFNNDDLPADITLGKFEPSFKGWLDDFKMIDIGSGLSPELYCEHARGTLVALDYGYTGYLAPMAMAATAQGQAIHHALAVNGYARLQAERYSCYVDYQNFNGANLAQIPADTTSLRQALLIPQGLTFGRSRPDEQHNMFCLSCHIDEHPRTLNKINALSANPAIRVEDDLRRQPSQPLPILHGIIPAALFGVTGPVDKIMGPVRVDKYVLPRETQ